MCGNNTRKAFNRFSSINSCIRDIIIGSRDDDDSGGGDEPSGSIKGGEFLD
jgi:hypothetical protein